MVVALLYLLTQSWYLCPEYLKPIPPTTKWWDRSANYAAQVMGIMLSFQVLHSVLPQLFGSTFRPAIYKRNFFVLFYCLMLFCLSFIVLMGPNIVGCLLRVNCGKLSVLEKMNIRLTPGLLNILGFFGDNALFGYEYSPHNLISMEFRVTLWCLGMINGACLVGWEYFIVVGKSLPLLNIRLRKRWSVNMKKEKEDALSDFEDEEEDHEDEDDQKRMLR
jgi:cation-transporting ATPase 13A3/4/5